MAHLAETRARSALGLDIRPFLCLHSPSYRVFWNLCWKTPFSSSSLIQSSNSNKHVHTHTCDKNPQWSLLLLFWCWTKGLAPTPILAVSPSGFCVRNQCYRCWLSHDASRRLLRRFRYNNKEQMSIHREEREMFWSGFLEMNFHATFISDFIVFLFPGMHIKCW